MRKTYSLSFMFFFIKKQIPHQHTIKAQRLYYKFKINNIIYTENNTLILLLHIVLVVGFAFA